MRNRFIIALALLLFLCGCTKKENQPSKSDTTPESLIGIRVDETVIISNPVPEQEQTVSLITSFAQSFLDDYYFGKGPDVVASAYIQTYGKKPLQETVTISWTCSAENTGYTLAYSTNAQFSDAVLVETDTPSVSLSNLYTGQTYYWQIITHLENEDNYSEIFSFQTASSPRILSIPGVSNARDIGGYLTEDNTHRVAQGMVYRGASLDSITGEGMRIAVNDYGIKTDLDLRSPSSESDNMLYTDKSPILSDVTFVNIPGVSYSSALSSVTKMRSELEVFTNKENYPIYIHCLVGRDRTGTLVYILGALLGVSEKDLLADYELTYLTAQGYAAGDMRGHNNMSDFLIQFHKLPGDTLQQKAESYCRSIGMSDAQIRSIREIMLEKIK